MRVEPICSVEAEQALLGCALFDPAETIPAVAGLLKPEQFYEAYHGEIFRVIAGKTAELRPADAITVFEAVKHWPAAQELGGVRYLADLIDRAPTSTNAPEYARIIGDLAARRALVKVAEEIRQEAEEDPDALGAGLVVRAEKRLAAMANDGPTQHQWRPVATVIRSAVATAQARGGRIDYPCGVAEVDAHLGGLCAGEMTVIAGRPGMGKSVVGMTIARANAEAGKGTLFFSLEMADEPLGLRLAADLCFDRMAPRYMGVSDNPTYDAARKGRLSPDQWERLNAAADQWERARHPLLLDTRPSLTVSQIEAAAHRAFRSYQRQGIAPGPVIVDHLGIISPELERGGNKVAETGDVSRSLAAMAKRLGVPVVALSQINRVNESRADKRPELHDLKWSGDIEADARQVILLFRPEAYLFAPINGGEDPMDTAERETKLRQVRNKLWWIVAKANNGPTGQVETFIDIGCSAIRSPNPSAMERAA